jgi:primosomal replication protein N
MVFECTSLVRGRGMSQTNQFFREIAFESKWRLAGVDHIVNDRSIDPGGEVACSGGVAVVMDLMEPAIQG